MNKFILARKLGMSQVFGADGRVVPVTLLEAGPNVVVQVKNDGKDGYQAVQIAFGKTRPKLLSKPLRGHLKNVAVTKQLREFRTEDSEKFKRGDVIKVGIFEAGDKVTVSANSIGRGFQGVVKRHGFSGGPASHGHRHVLRAPGSIGSSFPQRVFKGKKMAGRMGAERVSIKNIEVVRVDEKSNLMFVKGAVPGKRGTLVEVVVRNNTADLGQESNN